MVGRADGTKEGRGRSDEDAGETTPGDEARVQCSELSEDAQPSGCQETV